MQKHEVDQEPRQPKWMVEVRVLPKPGVNDPHGDAVRSGLHALGFTEAGDVRCGKLLMVEVAAHDQSGAEQSARTMCERLLANPVIEAYDVAVVPGTGTVERWSR